MSSSINLDSSDQSGIINGSVQFTPVNSADSCNFTQINFLSSVTISGTAVTTNIIFNNCVFTTSSVSAFICSNSSATITFYNCKFTITGASAPFNITAVSSINLYNCQLTNTSTVSSNLQNITSGSIIDCIIQDNLNFRNASCTINSCNFNTLNSGSLACVTLDSSSNINIFNSSFKKSNTASNWVDGSGNLTYGGIVTKGLIVNSALSLDQSYNIQTPTLITTPVSSAIATTLLAANFGLTTTVKTNTIQNTLGYNILMNISFTLSVPAIVQFFLGVGPSSSPTTPTTNSVTPTYNSTTVINTSFVAIVPSNYYVRLTYTGSLTAISGNVQICPF
jgi:hypothetical protein